MADVNEQIAALIKRIESLEKRDRHRRKSLERAHARIDFLTKLMNNCFPWQKTAPIIRLRDVADEDVPYVCEYLASARTFNRIDASYCQLSAASLDAIAEMLKEAKHIHELDLARVPLNESAGAAISSVLTNGDSLRTLNLHSIGLTDATFEPIANAVRSHPNLTTLTVSSNQLTEKSMALLAPVLGSTGCRLRTLNLSRNALGASGVSTLVESIGSNKSLQKLFLQEVGAGDEGAAKLAALLKTSNLQLLAIANNKVTSEGMTALVEALRVNKSLTTIVLYGNPIGDEGAAALATVIKTSTTLIDVDARHCQIGVEGGRAIAEVVGSSRLDSLGIHGNEIGAVQQASITAAFKGRSLKDEDEDKGLERRSSIMRIFNRSNRDKDEDDDEKADKGTMKRNKSKDLAEPSSP